MQIPIVKWEIRGVSKFCDGNFSFLISVSSWYRDCRWLPLELASKNSWKPYRNLKKNVDIDVPAEPTLP